MKYKVPYVVVQEPKRANREALSFCLFFVNATSGKEAVAQSMMVPSPDYKAPRAIPLSEYFAQGVELRL